MSGYEGKELGDDSLQKPGQFIERVAARGNYRAQWDVLFMVFR